MKYYLHDSNSFNDEKVTLLYMKYGYEGVGLFYVILEKLSQQEKPVPEIVLKTQLNIKKKLEKVLNFMYEIDVLSIKNGEVFSETLLNFSEKYKIKKEKTRIKVAEWRNNQKDKKTVTSYVPVSNPDKVKESKVKESKVNVREPSLHSVLQKIFLDYYLENKQMEYYWTAKEAGSLKNLIVKLKYYTEEEKIPDAFRIMLEQNKDKWINDNLSVSVINSKFNEIVSKIKGSTDPRLEEIERKFDNVS